MSLERAFTRSLAHVTLTAIPVLLAVARITTALHQSPAVPSDDADSANQDAPLRRLIPEEEARAVLRDVVAFAGHDISFVSSLSIPPGVPLTLPLKSDAVWQIYVDWELGLFVSLPEAERYAFTFC